MSTQLAYALLALGIGGICWLVGVLLDKLERYLRHRRMHQGIADYLRQTATRKR